MDRRCFSLSKTFIVKRANNKLIMLVMLPLLLMNVSNLLKDANDVIRAIIMLLFLIVIGVLIYYFLRSLKYKNGVIALEIARDYIGAGEKKVHYATIKSMQISNRTLWLRLRRGWVLDGYIVDAEQLPELANLLKQVADQHGIKFRRY